MQSTEGKIIAAGSPAPEPWDPREQLTALDGNRVKFSRGFMSARPARWFPQLGDMWIPFLHSLGVEVEFQSAQTSFNFPKDIERLVVVEVDGESAVIGYSEEAERTIAKSVIPGVSAVPAEMFVEYLQRRFLSTLSAAWGGPDALQCHFLSGDTADEVDVVGAIELRLKWSGKTVVCWFGLGVRVVEKLDAFSRKLLRQQEAEIDRPAFDDGVHTITVELAQLSVPPTLLIDYTRVGTNVDLDIPLGDRVLLFLDGLPWAEAHLRQFNDALAVEVTKIFSPSNAPSADAPSRVSIEVARLEIDEASLAEFRQPGAVMVTNAGLDGRAQLVIGGESVAQVKVGKLRDNFALTVLPR